MNINDVELKKKQKTEIPDIKQSDNQEINLDREPIAKPTTRSTHDWWLILKLSVAIALCIGIMLGTVAGFLIGRSVYRQEPTNSTDGNNINDTNTEDSIYSQYDYSKYIINSDKNITIESFYADDEERYFAMNLIGTTIPELKYLDSDQNELLVKDLGGDRYIIEVFQPDCAFCNSTIEVVDAYRADSPTIPIIGLSIKDGSLDAFNKNGTHSYRLVNKDASTAKFVDLIVWVPTFVYVENNVVKLVTFGLVDGKEDIYNNIDIAFSNKSEE